MELIYYISYMYVLPYLFVGILVNIIHYYINIKILYNKFYIDKKISENTFNCRMDETILPLGFFVSIGIWPLVLVFIINDIYDYILNGKSLFSILIDKQKANMKLRHKKKYPEEAI